MGSTLKLVEPFSCKITARSTFQIKGETRSKNWIKMLSSN